MNLAARSKKRVVLPSRPDPPSVDQILEDVDGAAPNDLVFSILDKTGQEPSQPVDGDVVTMFQQCRRFLELNEQLQEARARLQRQREDLKATGDRLDGDVAKVKSQPL